MGLAAKKAISSAADGLAREDSRTERHKYLNGEAFAMARA